MMKNAQSILALWASATAVMLFGCGRGSDNSTSTITMGKYDMAIRSGISGKGYAGEFNRLFSKPENIISYYSGTLGTSQWTSQIGLHGRYVVRMTCPITLDSERTNIVSEGTPEFYIFELKKIEVGEGGAISCQINQVPFSPQTWKQLVLANGDFSAAGIKLETNQPVANFDSSWRRFK